MVLRLELGVAIVPLDHLLALDEEARIERHVRSQEGLLVLLVDLSVRGLGILSAQETLGQKVCLNWLHYWRSR